MAGVPLEHIDPPIWATSLHRELKKEFLEVYKDNFPPDRLEYLAHAYANVQLRNCRYPESVIREVTVLGKSLLGVDRFLNRGLRAKEKSAAEGSSQAGGQTESSEKITVGCSKHDSCSDVIDSEPTSSVKKKLLAVKVSSPYHEESYENRNEFNAFDSIENTSKIRSSCMTPSFSIQDGQSFACQNISEFSLPANLFSDYSSTNEKNGMASEETCNKSIASACKKFSVVVPRASYPNRKSECVDTRKLYGSALIQAFKTEFLMQLEIQDLVPAAAKSADLLRIQIKFKIVERPGCTHTTIFDCDFYLKDIIMASAEGSSKKAAKCNAVKAAHEMLISASDFVVTVTEDRKFVEPVKTSLFADVPDEFAASNSAADSPNSFSLNYELLYNSLLLRFVLFDNSENRPLNQRSALLVLNDSAKLCQTSLIYDTVSTPQSFTSVNITLRGKLVGFATKNVEADARRCASEMALAKLRKEIYTVKVKKENACGILITPKVIFENYVTDILSEINAEPDMSKVCRQAGDAAAGFNDNSPGAPYGPAEITLEDIKENKKLFQNLLNTIDDLLRQYSNSKIFDDIIFSTEFSGRDRTEFSKMATSHNLQTLFRKVDKLYYLRVRRKFTMTQILNHLVQSGGSSCQYILLDGENEPWEM